MTEPAWLVEIKARRAAISPAPWKRGDEWTSNLVSDAEGEIVVYDEGRPGEDDADFITHAPADIDRLVGEVTTTEEIVRALAYVAAPIDSEFGYCHLCEFEEPGPASVWRASASAPQAHRPECPWRRAVEWVRP